MYSGEKYFEVNTVQSEKSSTIVIQNPAVNLIGNRVSRLVTVRVFKLVSDETSDPPLWVVPYCEEGTVICVSREEKSSIEGCTNCSEIVVVGEIIHIRDTRLVRGT